MQATTDDERSESARDNFGKFINPLQPEIKPLIMKLERILIKLYRQNMSLLFNQTCFNKRLLLNYPHFKIHDPAAHHDTDTQKYRCSLVKRQINDNRERINTQNTEAHNLRNIKQFSLYSIITRRRIQTVIYNKKKSLST